MVVNVMLKIRQFALCSVRNSKDKHTNKDMHL